MSLERKFTLSAELFVEISLTTKAIGEQEIIYITL